MMEMCRMVSIDPMKSRLCHISKTIGGYAFRRESRRHFGPFKMWNKFIYRKKTIEESLELNKKWEIKHHPIVEDFFEILQESLYSPSSLRKSDIGDRLKPKGNSLKTENWDIYKQSLEEIWSSLHRELEGRKTGNFGDFP